MEKLKILKKNFHSTAQRKDMQVVPFDRELFVVYVKPMKPSTCNVPIRRKMQKTAQNAHLKGSEKTG